MEEFEMQETAVMEPEMGTSQPVGIEAFRADVSEGGGFGGGGGAIPQFRTARGYEMYIQMRNQTLNRLNRQTEVEIREGVTGLLLDSVRKASPEAALEAAPWMTKPNWAKDPESIQRITQIVKKDSIERKNREDEILKMKARPSLDINPLSRAVDRYSNLLKDPTATPEEIKLHQGLLESFAIKNNSNVTFDEQGNVTIQPGLSTATRGKLQEGLTTSQAMLKVLDNITDDKIDNAFGAGSAMRDIGQSMGAANIGLGHTTGMTDVFMDLETIKPMVRTAIQNEKGATTEGDVARAQALLADFRRNSPTQAKDKLRKLREIVVQAQERQAAALAKAPSVQKQERDAAQAAQGGQAAPAGQSVKQLDANTARQFFMQANGDKAKARELARQAGYTF